MLFSILGIMLGVSCSDSDDEMGGEGDGGTTATTPFKSVQVEADGEKVEGTVDGTTITFAFDQAENFSDCKLIVEVNVGYQLTYPTDVNSYDMTDDPDLYFKGPDGKTVKYTVKLTSNALPIIDASKITVDGGYKLTVNNATKEIVITYDQNMDRSNVKLNFAEGALMAGATVEAVVFDLSDEPATVNIKVAGSNRPYTLKIDYSAIMIPAKDLGFVDITENFLDTKEYPYITVVRATRLSQVMKQKPTKVPSPDWWNPNECYPGMTQTEAMGVLGDFKDPTTYPGLEDIDNVNVTVVTMDATKVKGRMEIDDQNGLTLSEVKGLVTMTGRAIGSKGSQGGRGILYGNNKIYSWLLPWMEKQPENIQFGWHFGFTAEGKLLCDVATTNAGATKTKLHKVIFNEANISEDIGNGVELYREPYNYGHQVFDFDCHNYLNGDWNVVSAAYSYPCFARDGIALTYKQILGNNGFSDNMGDNVYAQLVLIGKTFDGKVALAVVTKENDTDSTMTPLQAAYVLYKMGWKDIMCVGVTDWQSGSWNPGIMIDGKLVAGQDTDGSVCVIAFDAK